MSPCFWAIFLSQFYHCLDFGYKEADLEYISLVCFIVKLFHAQILLNKTLFSKRTLYISQFSRILTIHL